MKKNVFILFIIASTIGMQAQSMQMGTLLVEGRAGLEVYATEYNYKLKNTGFQKDTTINDGAANKNYTLGAEVGLAKWFSVGLYGKYNIYFTQTDDVTKAKPEANSKELFLALNLHLVKSTHYNLYLGTNLGFSSLKYNSNDIANSKLSGTGSYVDLHLGNRFYIKKFGFNLNIHVPSVNYNKMTSNNDLFNQYVISTWKGRGFGMSAGIQYRILK